MKRILFHIAYVLFVCLCFYVYSQRLFAADQYLDTNGYKVMFVSAKGGAIVYNMPYALSTNILKYEYGSRVLVSQKVRKETINGVSDCWYQTYTGYVFGYVFGGDLSETMPADVNPVTGHWVKIDGTALPNYFGFFASGKVSHGSYQQCYQYVGKWKSAGNTITLSEMRPYVIGGISDKQPLKIAVKFEIINEYTMIFRYRGYAPLDHENVEVYATMIDGNVWEFLSSRGRRIFGGN